MYKVEIKRVTFKRNRKFVSTTDTYYFTGENAATEANKFARSFNRNMPFYEDGSYDTAWKPSGCYSYSLNDVLLDAFDTIRKGITDYSSNFSNSIHTLGDHLDA